jgi:hypothetical protein
MQAAKNIFGIGISQPQARGLLLDAKIIADG